MMESSKVLSEVLINVDHLLIHKACPPKDCEVWTEKVLSNASVQRVMQREKSPKEGQLVGVRLNLNILQSTGLAIQTLHEAPKTPKHVQNRGFFNGIAIDYQHAVLLKNAFFNVDQNTRERIATHQEHKTPMASVDGEFMPLPENMNDFKGIEIRFNPHQTHLFVNAENQAIRSAEYALVLGHRVYVAGLLEWHCEQTAPEKKGSAPSKARVYAAPSATAMRSQLPLPWGADAHQTPSVQKSTRFNP